MYVYDHVNSRALGHGVLGLGFFSSFFSIVVIN
jgi:hypothetical protein